MMVRRFGWLLAAWLALAAGGVALARSAPPRKETIRAKARAFS